MKPVTIAVLTKEPGLTADLARGLAELGRHFMIRTDISAEDFKEYAAAGKGENHLPEEIEVLITDFDEKSVSEAGFEPSEVVWLDRCTLRLQVIYGRIMEIADRKRTEDGGVPCGGTGRTGEWRRPVFLSFFSRRGGSGVTAAAVTMGRFLAGMYGEKVLYISLQQTDDSRIYRGAENDDMETGGETPNLLLLQELRYRLEQKKTLDMEPFIGRDAYGLEYLNLNGTGELLCGLDREELGRFLRTLAAQTGYQWILMDWGKNSGIPNWTVPLEFCRNEGSKERTVKVADCLFFEIPEDRESFCIRPAADSSGTSSFGRTEISMSKSYGAAVRTMAMYFMEDESVPNGVEL